MTHEVKGPFALLYQQCYFLTMQLDLLHFLYTHISDSHVILSWYNVCICLFISHSFENCTRAACMLGKQPATELYLYPPARYCTLRKHVCIHSLSCYYDKNA